MFALKIAEQLTKASEDPKSTPAIRRWATASHQSGHDSVKQALLLQQTLGNQAARRIFASQAHDPSAFLNLIADASLSGLPSGYGATMCKIPGGPSTSITTSGCNRPCTEAHERVHFDDIKDCCNQANAEYLLAGSLDAKDRVKSTWRSWANSIRPITECRAYDVSVPCAQKAQKEKKCERDSMTADERECCGEIKLALDDDIAGQGIYSCDKTPRSLPPCPFGPSGPRNISRDATSDDSTLGSVSLGDTATEDGNDAKLTA